MAYDRRQFTATVIGAALGAGGITAQAASAATQALEAAAGTDTARQSWGFWRTWGDQGDGTFRNPVLPADFSDLDVIRRGADYYAISSTLQLSPGMSVLHSTDLVNWTLVGHVVEDLTALGPEFDWRRMNRYRRGVWAGSIRHHGGRFWVFFGTPDEGFFVSSAIDPAGPWSAPLALLSEPGWDDCSALWDDDGQAYFVGTRFADDYKTYIFKMSPDGRSIDPASAVLVNAGHGREASKLLKIGDWYYLIFSEHLAGAGRSVMAKRARAPLGPYAETRGLAHVGREDYEPNQGGLVQSVNGDWWFLTHHGRGAWEGRAASLLPVSWRESWPVLGEVQADGLGSMVWAAPKPATGPARKLQTSDHFDAPRLGPQWQWNHQPRADRWSLSERPGWLRLRAWQPLAPGDLLKAGNTLSQRSFRTVANEVVVKIDVSGMADGQQAGLAHFSNVVSSLGVRQQGGVRRLERRDRNDTVQGPVIRQRQIWLRSRWGSDGLNRMAFSLNGRTYEDIGAPGQMTYANYRGDRVGLFSFNDLADAGHIDIDVFDYRYADQIAPPTPSLKRQLDRED